MKTLEKILGVVVLLGLVLKVVFIPGASIILTLSLTILTLLYFPFGFALLNQIWFRDILKKDVYKEISALRMIGTIGLGLSLSLICSGILFKLVHIQGAYRILFIGLLPMAIILVVSLLKFLKSRDKSYVKIFMRIAIIGGFGLIMVLSSDLIIEKIRFHNHPEYLKAYELYLKNPQNEKLREKVDLEYNKATMNKEDFELYLKYLEREKTNR